MIKMRYATVDELPVITDILVEVFQDSRQFVNIFLRRIFHENVLICEVECKIVSVAILLPATVWIKGTLHKITYLYACATLPEYRQRGLMKQILLRAYADVCAEGQLGVFLYPENADLALYYEKIGFKPFSPISTTLYCHSFSTIFPSNLRVVRATPEEYYTYCGAKYAKEGTICWDLSHFQLCDDLFLREKGSEGGFYFLTNDKTIEAAFALEDCGGSQFVLHEYFSEYETSYLYALISAYFQIEALLVYQEGTDFLEHYPMILLRKDAESFDYSGGYCRFFLE